MELDLARPEAQTPVKGERDLGILVLNWLDALEKNHKERLYKAFDMVKNFDERHPKLRRMIFGNEWHL